MPKTEEDAHFEAYLVEHGYDPGEHEPDLSTLGVDSRPDYMPANAVGDRVVCEVNQYVSAVAVLTGEALASVERRAVFAEVRAATPDFDKLSNAEQTDRLLAAVEGRTFSPGLRYRLDVIEALSSTATPLPGHWFSGPRDTRWRWTELEDGQMRLDRAWGLTRLASVSPIAESDADRDANPA